MGNIYRKSSMERLSSPEQLDKMIRIASPSLWIAVAGAALLVVSVMSWAVFGRLPDNVGVSGMYMTNTRNFGNYASYGGTVTDILVEKGQSVKTGDTLAVVTNEENAVTISQLQERIQAVEGVTLTSGNDTPTSDNAQLLEYKIEYRNAGMTLEERQTTLDALRGQLGQIQAEVASYDARRRAAEAEYLAALGDDSGNVATFAYQEAQAKLQTAQSERQSAEAELKAMEESARSLEQALQELEGQYESLRMQLDSLPEEAAEERAVLASQLEQLGSQISGYQSQKRELDSQLSQADQKYDGAGTALDEAQEEYDKARADYEEYYSSQNSRTAEQTRLSTAFQEASSLYSTAYSQQRSLEQQIREVSVTETIESRNTNVSRETVSQRFEAAKQSVLKDLKAQLEAYESTGGTEEIKAKLAGTVVDIPVEKNQLVGQGTEVVKVKSDSETENAEIVRCYVPLASGKQLREKMKAVVTPSTVDEQEYGHMTGQVASVGTYTVSSAEMLQVLGDEVSVQAYQQQGPCIEVLIALDTDESTASGYAWSNRKGRNVEIGENTPVSAKVRVKEDAPIQKLIPFLKSALSVENQTEEPAK